MVLIDLKCICNSQMHNIYTYDGGDDDYQRQKKLDQDKGQLVVASQNHLESRWPFNFEINVAFFLFVNNNKLIIKRRIISRISG